MLSQAFLANSTGCGKYYGCKCSLFNVENSHWVLSLLPILMHTVDILWPWAIRDLLEYPDIRECRSLVSAESTCKNNQPCALLNLLFSCSLLVSWGTGSLSISRHTALKSSGSRSLSSLCRCSTYPPRLQIMAWSNVKTFPHTHVDMWREYHRLASHIIVW